MACPNSQACRGIRRSSMVFANGHCSGFLIALNSNQRRLPLPRFTIPNNRLLSICALTLLILFLAVGMVNAQVPTTEISTDPFSNTNSQHATEVEPASYAFGSTIVSVFQEGRFFDGGSSDIGFATSTDGGSTWTHGNLP